MGLTTLFNHFFGSAAFIILNHSKPLSTVKIKDEPLVHFYFLDSNLRADSSLLTVVFKMIYLFLPADPFSMGVSPTTTGVSPHNRSAPAFTTGTSQGECMNMPNRCTYVEELEPSVSFIAVWADGSWCWEDELQVYMHDAGKSDDYKLLSVCCSYYCDPDWVAQQVADAFIRDLYKQQELK